MATSVDIRILVAVACILLIFALGLVAFLRGAWTDRFRMAANFFAGSLAALLVSALGVFLSQDAPFVVSAVLIISGAHFGIVFGCLSLHEALGSRPRIGAVIGLAGAVCLGQALLAAIFHSAHLLILTTSVVNAILSLAAAGSFWSLPPGTSRRNRLLASAPYFLIACAYGARLLMLLAAEPEQWFVLASSIIAFVLASASLYLGFALIILRESALSDALRRARAESEQILQQRTRLFSQMNHELRTPLNGIVGLTRVLSGQVVDEKGARTVRDLQASAALLKTVVDDVLDFAKLDSGALVLETVDFNLPDLVEGIASQYRALAAEKAVAVRVEADADLMAWRRGDPMRLRQILHNILANSVKFTAAGEIAIAMEAPGGDLIRLRVSDTGIGMTEEQLGLLFEPFRQATASTARQFGGTGLGMSIVKMLVEALGGQIGVQSAPGAGTTVEIVLPLAGAEAPEPPEAALPAPTADHALPGDLRVLCADDDEINRLVLQAFLVELGISPVMAASGTEAITLGREGRFDLYLIDINMPEMGGVETLAALRRIDGARPGRPPLAVAVTANVMADDIQSYLEAGFDVHLPKPIVFEDLCDLLRQARPGAGAEGRSG